MTFRDYRRRALSAVMIGLSAMAVLAALIPVGMILFFVVGKGASLVLRSSSIGKVPVARIATSSG